LSGRNSVGRKFWGTNSRRILKNRGKILDGPGKTLPIHKMTFKIITARKNPDNSLSFAMFSECQLKKKQSQKNEDHPFLHEFGNAQELQKCNKIQIKSEDRVGRFETPAWKNMRKLHLFFFEFFASQFDWAM
jgi:hypothetical protein